MDAGYGRNFVGYFHPALLFFLETALDVATEMLVSEHCSDESQIFRRYFTNGIGGGVSDKCDLPHDMVFRPHHANIPTRRVIVLTQDT